MSECLSVYSILLGSNEHVLDEQRPYFSPVNIELGVAACLVDRDYDGDESSFELAGDLSDGQLVEGGVAEGEFGLAVALEDGVGLLVDFD